MSGEKWSEELGEPVDDVTKIAELGRLAAGPLAEEITPDVTPVFLVRERTWNQQSMVWADAVRVLDVESYAHTPLRRKGIVMLDQAASFTAYVNEFKSERARIYADIAAPEVTAVFDDDDPALTGDPHEGAWREHRAVLRMQRTPEWERWREHDTCMVGQVEFAEFLEINLREIIEPAAADLIEIARSFTASSETSFRSAHSLQSGETQFTYEESIDAKAGAAGKVAIPKEFKLSIAPFRGSPKVEITARLRYRLKSGQLTLGYLLDKPREVEDDAFAATLGEIAETTGIAPLFGRPAAQRT